MGAPIELRFADFEVNPRSGALRRNGIKVKLQEQPFQILVLLLERRGEIVSREDIRQKLWTADTFVDFDNGLNIAVKKLRIALGDDADAPAYIETLPRRGYRFIAPVTRTQDPAAEANGLVGKKVSHYRVLEVIGGGGMGLVYKAEDLKLGRRVALKFLPEELATDAIALQRFDREARTASSLSHAHICTIYEVEEYEGQPFMVMELLEGETLRDRLAASEGALALEEMLDIALQVTDGLAAAHERGIIHRDIKPANIFITSKGVCKILDFGIAKLLVEAPGGLAVEAPGSARVERGFSPASQPPSSVPSGLQPGDGPKPAHDNRKGSLERGPEGPLYPPAAPPEPTLTRTGLAMGTAGYMSPEQVRGEKLDARTDIFSFGLVLYEMATGQRAFSGQTAALLHGAILHNTPIPVRELNSTLPAKLVTMIDKCLEKDRERRYQSAEDLGTDLRALPQCSSVQSRDPRMMFAGALAVVLCLGGFLAFRARLRKPEASKEFATRQLTSTSASEFPFTLSPDGRHLAYSEISKGISLLQIDTGDNSSLPDTASFAPISWLPDGDHLFVSKHGTPGTWTISVLDGTVRRFRGETILPYPSPDGRRLAFENENGEVWVTGTAGEVARKIVSIDPPWTLDNFTWSPTGTRIAYDKSRAGRADRSKNEGKQAVLESCDLQGRCSPLLSNSKLLIEGWGESSALAWLPDGRILFALTEPPPNNWSTNLWSLSVDPNTGLPQGEPTRMTGWTGSIQGMLTASANGRRLVFEQAHPESMVKIAEFRNARGGLVPARALNSETWYTRVAVWTPDSKTVLFVGTGYGKKGIFRQNVDSPSPRPLVSGSAEYGTPVVSPDGKWLLYTEGLEDGTTRLMRVPIEGGQGSLVLSGDYGYRCASAPATLCLVSELSGTQLIFSVLDPVKGLSGEVTRADIKKASFLGSYGWSLSPDGKSIALVIRGEEQVRIISTQGAGVRLLPLKGWNDLQYVNWKADGSSLYLSGEQRLTDAHREYAIFELNLAGNFKALAHVSSYQGWIANPVPSPDGRYLIYTERSWPSSVMMLENF